VPRGRRFARLVRTTTFRLTLVYLGLFMASVLVILGMIWWFTAGYVERQTNETIAVEIAGLREQYQRRGLVGLAEVVAERAAVPRTDGLYLLAGPDYRPIAGNVASWPRVPPSAGGWITFAIPDTVAEEGRHHIGRAIAFTLPAGYRLLVGRDMRERQAYQQQVFGALGWALLMTLVLGVAGGVLISRHMTRRLEAVNETTAKIMTGDLHERVGLRGTGDEFDELAANLNAMLDQIERLMTGMRQVTENVAHDLRTPLTRLRSRLELALLETPADPAAYRAVLQETIAEADRLLAVFTALMSIAETESGTVQARFEPVPLGTLAHGVAELYEAVAEEKGVALGVRADADPRVEGSAQLLSQALANLLDNAVKYTPAGGRITVTVTDGADGSGPRLAVADTGPGVPAADRERVLRRFVRLEQSRSSAGNGLGLSLVAAVAALHRATLKLADAGPGLSVTLAFPPAGGQG
jgi:signal transduction histidine kinase